MQRQDFHYDLPEELIAKQPAQERRASRLLSLNGESGEIQHGVFSDILNYVQAGDVMVFNDTRVIPARVFGQKATGGKLEILVERIVEPTLVLAMLRSSKSPQAGSEIILEEGTRVQVEGREQEFFLLRFPKDKPALDILEAIGHMPLPPYIDRADAELDRERYQTVYGKNKGAVAAPTAGLHFDEQLLQELNEKGVELAFVTLHVGAGTFLPMRVDNIHEHKMHSEVMRVDETVCTRIKACKERGGRVIAVGTTSVRCLESAARGSELHPFQGETNIFIFPGFEYKIVDALVTNFHLPESTLLMLVSAFAGYQHTMQAYRAAVAERYRFFSYGDAMFITRNSQARSTDEI